MKIALFTNTYLPHVGGVAESVKRFADAYRAAGHDVLVVTPWIDGDHADAPGVVRVPAWEHAWGTEFSVPLPSPGLVHQRIEAFGPEIVHAHHPFLLGDTALRVAASRGLPTVFTNHTQYDVYAHYLPWDSLALRRFAVRIAIGYANLCDRVIAPSDSIRRQLTTSGVVPPVEVVPTGVDLGLFSSGDGRAFRRRTGIPRRAYVVGHVGRLAPEKNLGVLADAVSAFLASHPDAWAVVAGEGPERAWLESVFIDRGVADRLVLIGVLHAEGLADAYAAMDAFAFTSVTETQGLVLVEAMASATPVVAFDAPGARDLIRDGINGRLVEEETPTAFGAALRDVAERDEATRAAMRAGARETAEDYAMPRCASSALRVYEDAIASRPLAVAHDRWRDSLRALAQEWRIWRNVVHAGASAAMAVGEE